MLLVDFEVHLHSFEQLIWLYTCYSHYRWVIMSLEGTKTNYITASEFENMQFHWNFSIFHIAIQFYYGLALSFYTYFLKSYNQDPFEAKTL